MLKRVKSTINYSMARKPRFVVIGTPRSGTSYFSALCKANGIQVSHEDYFTEFGPMLRNPRRRFDTVGDVSWLAVPYLPDEDMIVIHQVRNPLKVVNSIHRMGLFHGHRAYTREAFVETARRNFQFSDDPLRSAIRFYVEWNEKCEALTDKRYKVEELEAERHRIADWLNLNLDDLATVSKTTNTRSAEVDEEVTLNRLSAYPEFNNFIAKAKHYGYDLG